MIIKKHILPALLAFGFFVSSFAMAGEIQKSLGHQSLSFGSYQQASALLALINNHRGEKKFQINYETSSDTVIFGCDLSAGTMARIHQRKDGTGTAENWTGEIEYRLRSAAKGGSLNDTSKGKIPGRFLSF